VASVRVAAAVIARPPSGRPCEPGGLGHQGADVLVGELAAAALEQLLAGARGDEHPDSSSLVEDPVGHQLVEALGGGRGVDAVEGAELVRGRRLGLLGQGAVDDRVLDLRRDLPEDGPGVLVHPQSRAPETCAWCLGSLLM
jgi:hypothetical protein